MLNKIAGLVIILAGIAGLVLPVVPGVLLITIGTLIFFNKHDKLIKRR